MRDIKMCTCAVTMVDSFSRLHGNSEAGPSGAEEGETMLVGDVLRERGLGGCVPMPSLIMLRRLPLPPLGPRRCGLCLYVQGMT